MVLYFHENNQDNLMKKSLESDTRANLGPNLAHFLFFWFNKNLLQYGYTLLLSDNKQKKSLMYKFKKTHKGHIWSVLPQSRPGKNFQLDQIYNT